MCTRLLNKKKSFLSLKCIYQKISIRNLSRQLLDTFKLSNQKNLEAEKRKFGQIDNFYHFSVFQLDQSLD